MKKICVFFLALSLLLGCMLPLSVSVWAADETTGDDATAPTGVTTSLVITEVCFNPAYETNSLGIDTNADVFEFFEIYNASGETVSLADVVAAYSVDGYEGFELEQYSSSVLYALSTNTREIYAGEIAIVAVYGKETATAGLGYASDAEIQAYYDAFAAFYGCQRKIYAENFYIVPKYESGTTTKISSSFNLTNTTEDVVLRLQTEDAVLAETHYSPVAWNKNNTSLHMSWLAGMDPTHPEASVAFATGTASPGVLKDNQMRETVLTPADGTDLLAVKAMHYNVCSTDCTQTNADGSAFTMEQRIEGVFSTIKAKDADVIGLCEVNYVWVPEIKKTLTTEEGGYSGFGMSSQGRLFSGDVMNVGQTWDFYNLIMWKTEKYNLIDSGYFWCSSTPDRANSYTWEDGTTGDFGRCINWVILEDKESGADFFFMCAHIDAKSSSVRTKSTTLIRNRIAQLAGTLPVIVVGDWNCAENSSAYAKMATGGIVDVRYRVTDPADMTVRGTFNKWGANTDIGGRLPIDLCFVTGDDVFVNSAHMDYGYYGDTQLFSSDHHPTVYDLSLMKKYLPEVEEETQAPVEDETQASPEGGDSVPEEVTQDEADTATNGDGAVTDENGVTVPADTLDPTADTLDATADESDGDTASADGTDAEPDGSQAEQGTTATPDGTQADGEDGDGGCASVSYASVLLIMLLCALPVALLRRKITQ